MLQSFKKCSSLLPIKKTNLKNHAKLSFVMYFVQEAGDIEAEITECGIKHVLKKILTSRDPGAPMLPKGKSFDVSPESPIILPSWLSEEDIDYYAAKYEEKGFTGPLNHYRNLDW